MYAIWKNLNVEMYDSILDWMIQKTWTLVWQVSEESVDNICVYFLFRNCIFVMFIQNRIVWGTKNIIEKMKPFGSQSNENGLFFEY